MNLVSPAPSFPLAPAPTWSSNLTTSRDPLAARTSTGARTGQFVPGAPADVWSTVGTALAVAGTGLGAYHGYRRTGSVGWAIAWAILGGLFPIITLPIAYAQGFARPDPGFPAARRAART